MISKFNRDFTDNEAIENVVKRLTGQNLTLEFDELAAVLAAAGVSYQEYDPLFGDLIDQFSNVFFAAFYAGYKVGRNPDLLILAADDSGDGAE